MFKEGLKLESLLEGLFTEEADLEGVKIFKFPRSFDGFGYCCDYGYGSYDK